MQSNGRSLASDVVATFFAASAADGIIDHIDCEAEIVRAFAASYGYDDVVQLLRDAYCGRRVDDGRRLRETLRHGPDGREHPYYPDYILILLLCCIVQREIADMGRGSQNIRHALSRRLDFHVESLDGLPALWEALKHALARQDLELVLPDEGFRLVRYHRFLVFPVHSDRTRVERLLLRIPKDRRLDDEEVARAVARSEKYGQAYKYHFEKWLELWEVGDPRDQDATFWKVLERSRRELDRRGRLVVRPSDTFPFELRTYALIDGLETSVEDLSKIDLVGPVSNAVARGRVELSNKGMDRYADCSDGARCDLVLLERSLAGNAVDSRNHRSVSGGRWFLVPSSVSMSSLGRTVRDVGWSDGTKVGRALLHAGPFSPRYWARPPAAPLLCSERGPVRLLPVEGANWRVEADALDGRLRLGTSVPLERSTFLELEARSTAVPHHPDRIREFDPAKLLHEDGILERTAPSLPTECPTELSATIACEPDHRLKTLGEALYARSALGIGYGEAIRLVRMIAGDDTPSVWDILRTFIDAGWFEVGWVRGAEARLLCPRRPRLIAASHGLLLDGMVCREDVLRLAACARRHGAELRIVRGSPWEAAVAVVEGAFDRGAEVAQEARLPIDGYVERPIRRPSEAARAIGPKEGWSVRQQFGVLRASRDDGHEAPYWLVKETWEQTHQSATTAFLHQAEVSGEPAFVWRRGRLERRVDGATLPNSWARWLRVRSGRSAGVDQVDGSWVYGYPADRQAARALATATSAIRAHDPLPAWVSATRQSSGDRRIVVRGKSMGLRG
ncbi:MAG: hypothetical protein NXI14_06935 [bacterium]|nr:hypothetical protein [bacterium]